MESELDYPDNYNPYVDHSLRDFVIQRCARETLSTSPQRPFLDVSPGAFGRLFGLVRFLPATWRNWLESRYPEQFLPTRIVMKRQKLDWNDDAFENEKEIYRMLAPVQGTVVPKYYGEAECPKSQTYGQRALILSDISGVSLHEGAAGHLDPQHLEDMLWESIGEVARLGVAHEDLKLDNYLLVDDRIMLIDFDSSAILDGGDPETITGDDVWHLCSLYHIVHRAREGMFKGISRVRFNLIPGPPPPYDRRPVPPPGFVLPAPPSTDTTTSRP